MGPILLGYFAGKGRSEGVKGGQGEWRGKGGELAYQASKLGQN